MYAETGLMFPYFHYFNQEVQQIDEFCSSLKPSAPLDVPNTTNNHTTPLMPEYNLWGEGDLFKAPEPTIEEEQVTGLDPISMISCREDLLSDVFYECKKDLLAKEGNDVEETPLSEALISILKTPNLKTDENAISDEKLIVEGPFPKSVSSTCLSSLGHHQMRPSFLDLPAVDYGSVYGMRRAFSEGDIKTFGNDNNNSLVQSGTRRTNITSTEDRREKLSRYRNKKAKRNFARKIKYACRKALADSQPRIRGRFAKNNEVAETMKKL